MFLPMCMTPSPIPTPIIHTSALNLLLQEGKNYVLLLTTYARAQFVVIVVQDAVQNVSGCWQFPKSAMGTSKGGHCFLREELLFRSLGLGPIDILMGRGSIF